MVTDAVVASDSLPIVSTAEGMVPKRVPELQAGWAGTILLVNLDAKSVPGRQREL